MLISSLSLDSLGDIKLSNACVFPDLDCASLYDAIMVPLDRIVSVNQAQLQNVTAEETLPRKWWSNRKEVDEKLRDLVVEVERTWFASEAAQSVLVGDENVGDSLPFHVNLASRFEAATISSSTSMSEEESVDSTRTGACTLLVLDENLQRFPFESLSMFEGHTLCRQPSLPFLAAKLLDLSGDSALEFQHASVDMQKVGYVLDPESNLSATTKRLHPFLEGVESRCSATPWQRVIREHPPKDFIEQSLTQPAGLYLFFGHGNGQSYFSKSDVVSLIGSGERDATQRRVRSSVVLMGCSSGRLESVNRKDTKLLDRQLPLYHEPEGLALYYIGAGANCVVGNLWDVTDRDIDTFAMKMLERFTADDTCTSIAECVAHSRMACKLRYATGGAPVCYGIPVFRKDA
jgi:separase